MVSRVWRHGHNSRGRFLWRQVQRQGEREMQIQARIPCLTFIVVHGTHCESYYENY